MGPNLLQALYDSLNAGKAGVKAAFAPKLGGPDAESAFKSALAGGVGAAMVPLGALDEAATGAGQYMAEDVGRAGAAVERAGMPTLGKALGVGGAALGMVPVAASFAVDPGMGSTIPASRAALLEALSKKGVNISNEKKFLKDTLQAIYKRDVLGMGPKDFTPEEFKALYSAHVVNPGKGVHLTPEQYSNMRGGWVADIDPKYNKYIRPKEQIALIPKHIPIEPGGRAPRIPFGYSVPDSEIAILPEGNIDFQTIYNLFAGSLAVDPEMGGAGAASRSVLEHLAAQNLPEAVMRKAESLRAMYGEDALAKIVKEYADNGVPLFSHDLPMDEASRMARKNAIQRQAGAHGTQEKFLQFDPEMSAQGGIIWYAKPEGIETAADFAGTRKGANIVPLEVSNPHPAGWDQYDKMGLGELEKAGYTGADLGDTGFVFSPAQLRSKFAAFDPRMKDSRFLLALKAGAIPLAGLGAAASLEGQ